MKRERDGDDLRYAVGGDADLQIQRRAGGGGGGPPGQAAICVVEAELRRSVEQLERDRRRGVDDDAEADRPGAGLDVDGAVEDTVVIRVRDAHGGAVAERDAG